MPIVTHFRSGHAMDFRTLKESLEAIEESDHIRCVTYDAGNVSVEKAVEDSPHECRVQCEHSVWWITGNGPKPEDLKSWADRARQWDLEEVTTQLIRHGYPVLAQWLKDMPE